MSDNKTLPLPMKRKLYFTKQVDQSSVSDLMQKVIDINENDDHLEKLYPVYDMEYTRQPIEIYIDSYGGLVYQIFGAIGVINQSKTPVHTIVTGAAMSCGFMLLIHGHKRFAYEEATPLYHQVSDFMAGEAKNLEEWFKETKRLQKRVEEMTLERTKITKKKLKKIYKRKVDWFMTAEQALELGVVDKIIGDKDA